MINAIGWIGAFLMSFCGIPEAVRSYKNKNCCAGWGLLGMWGSGEVLLMIYICFKWDAALFFNYVVNILCIATLIYFKVTGEKNGKNKQEKKEKN